MWHSRNDFNVVLAFIYLKERRHFLGQLQNGHAEVLTDKFHVNVTLNFLASVWASSSCLCLSPEFLCAGTMESCSLLHTLAKVEGSLERLNFP